MFYAPLFPTEHFSPDATGLPLGLFGTIIAEAFYWLDVNFQNKYLSL